MLLGVKTVWCLSSRGIRIETEFRDSRCVMEYAPLSHERGQMGFTNAKLSVDTPPKVPLSRLRKLTLSSLAGLSVDNYIPVRRMEYLPRHQIPVTATVDEVLSTICNAAKRIQRLSFRVLDYDCR